MEAAGAAGAGVIGTGVGVWTGFGAACFLAAANVADAAGVGRADGVGALAGGADEREADAVAPGSGVMMLTGGVEEALGNSALVDLPVGTPGTSAATGAAATTGGVFQTTE